MGIFHLEKYILNSNSIVQQCDYIKEINKWRRYVLLRYNENCINKSIEIISNHTPYTISIFFFSISSEHESDPTIIIDLKELSDMIPRIFASTLRNGGVFDKYIDMLRYFFDELKKCHVDLVFFMRQRIWNDTEMAKPRIIKVTGMSHCRGLFEREDERLMHIMITIAKQYGELFITPYRNTIHMVNYTVDHADKVLSIIGNDTDYLIFDGNYQYWTMAKWFDGGYYPGMCGLRFDRSMMLAEIGLSMEQMRLFGSLWYALDDQPVRKSDRKFYDIVEYVKCQTLSDDNAFDWDGIAQYWGGESHQTLESAVKKRYSEYDINHRPGKWIDRLEDTSPAIVEVIEFCKRNHFQMLHSIVWREIGVVKDLFFLKENNSINIKFIDMIFLVVVKFPGILYKDEDQERRPMSWKLYNHLISGDGGDVEVRDIIYPPGKPENLDWKLFRFNNIEMKHCFQSLGSL